MKYDYKTIGIICLTIIALILLIILIIPTNKSSNNKVKDNDINPSDVVFKLLGNDEYQISSSDNYVEPGYIVYLKDGKNLSSYVTVTQEEIDDDNYYIKYNLEYNNIKQTLSRKIKIIEEIKTDEEDIILSLIGEPTQCILKDSEYKEYGAKAYNSKKIDISSKIKITNNVDTSKNGEYTVIYQIQDDSGKIKTVERKVIVYEMDYEIKINRLNDKINLTFICKDDYIIYISLDGIVNSIQKGENNFTINDDKEYEIEIFDKYNYSKKEKFNFVKPKISCRATINGTNTVVNVLPSSSNIKKYNYYFNNQKYESDKISYTLTGTYKNVSVEAIDINDNNRKVSCNVVDNTPVSYFESGLKKLEYNSWYYYLYVPEKAKINEKRPLLVFLHGSGERGNNYSLLEKYGFPKYIKNGKQYDAFILVPQLLRGTWDDNANKTMELINKIVSEYNIDQNKISLSGFSLGANGTTTLVKKNQNYFSCIVLIAIASNRTSYASYFKNIPVRFYTGSRDSTMGNSSYAKSFYKAIKKINDNVTWTVYDGYPHNVVDKVLEDGTVYNWMISQTK